MPLASSPGSRIGRKRQRGGAKRKGGEREPGLYCFVVYTFHCVAIVIMTIFCLLHCCYRSDVMYEQARSGVLTCWPACCCSADMCSPVICVFPHTYPWPRPVDMCSFVYTVGDMCSPSTGISVSSDMCSPLARTHR